jgi:hypothetical protein
MKLHGERVVAALRAVRETVTAQGLFLRLPLGIGVLELL